MSLTRAWNTGSAGSGEMHYQILEIAKGGIEGESSSCCYPISLLVITLHSLI